MNVRTPASQPVCGAVVFRLEVGDDVGGFVADFGSGGVHVSGRAVAGGAGDDGAVGRVGEPKDGIIRDGIQSFHWAGIDAEGGRAGHERTEGDVNLAIGPGVEPSFILGFLAEAGHHAAVSGERVGGGAGDGDHSGDIAVNLRFRHIVVTGENDEV